MPDISMCPGNGCPLREKCWRFTAPPSPHRQAYFLKAPNNADKSCDYYWPTELGKSTKTEEVPK